MIGLSFLRVSGSSRPWTRVQVSCLPTACNSHCTTLLGTHWPSLCLTHSPGLGHWVSSPKLRLLLLVLAESTQTLEGI